MGLGALSALVLLMISPVGPTPAHAEDKAPGDLLERMMRRSEGTSYIGRKHIFHFQRGPAVLEYEIVHKNSRMERKMCVRGEGEEGEVTVSDGSYIWHYMPSRELVLRRSIGVGMGPDIPLERDLELIKENYTVRVVKRGVTLAGRPVSVLEFIPKGGEKRPVRRIWLDDEKGMILRTDVFGLDGEIALMSCFTQIRFQPKIKDDDFILKVPQGTQVEPIQEKSFRSVEDMRPSAAFNILTPEYLPQGFILVGGKVYPRTGFEEVQLQFSDGLSTISLFQDNRKLAATDENIENEEEDSGREVKVGGSQGHLYELGLVRLLKWREGNTSLALVSELEAEEMLKIAESLE